MIIFNEKIFAEKIIVNGFSKNKFIYKECLLLARYLRHNLNKEYIFTSEMSEKQIKATQSIVDIELANKLNKFCMKYIGNFNIVLYANAIENIIQQSKTKPLREMKNVKITKKEIENIHQIEDYRYRKLLFAILVLAKYYHSEGKGYYCNFALKDIIQIANVNFSRIEKDQILNKLYTLGFINPTFNKSMEINFIDEENEELIEFSPDENLILYYERHVGEYVTSCTKCGILFRYTEKQKRSVPKYCKACKRSMEVVVPEERTCINCGKKYLASSKTKSNNRCNECYKVYRKEYNKKIYYKI